MCLYPLNKLHSQSMVKEVRIEQIQIHKYHSLCRSMLHRLLHSRLPKFIVHLEFFLSFQEQLGCKQKLEKILIMRLLHIQHKFLERIYNLWCLYLIIISIISLLTLQVYIFMTILNRRIQEQKKDPWTCNKTQNQWK